MAGGPGADEVGQGRHVVGGPPHAGTFQAGPEWFAERFGGPAGDRPAHGLVGRIQVRRWPEAFSGKAQHIKVGRCIGANFWVGFGGFRPVSEVESALALVPRGFEGRSVKMGKSESGGFFDFFCVFGRNWSRIGAF